MTQPRALYLADVLEGASEIADAAAAELRRLHAELERCKATCAATAEAWREDAEKWKVQRDALLEALRDIAEFSLEQPTKAVARTAIAAAEGEKT